MDNNAETMFYRKQANALIEFFTFAHLPPRLQEISRRFAELANEITEGQASAGLVMALRKLLEAKDCAVRNAIVKPTSGNDQGDDV